MSIQSFFNHVVYVKRMRDTSGGIEALQTTATVDCHIQALDLRSRQVLGLLEERAWIAYFDITDPVYEGDVIESDDGKRYEVREITKNDFGVNQHLEVILVERNA